MRLAAVLLLAAGAAFGQAGDLEKRIEALELRAKPAAGAPVDAWFERGLRFATDDDRFTARIGMNVIAHLLFHPRPGPPDEPTTFLMREVSPEFGARFEKSFEVFVSPDFGRNGPKLLYGWAEFNRWSELKLRVGQFKEPYSMEVLEETRWWDFVETSLIYMQAPVPDIGAMIHGRLLRGGMQYAIGVFNGNGALAGSDENSDKDLAARLVWTPSLILDDGSRFHLHFGHSATIGRERRRAPSTPFPMFDPATGTYFHQNPAAANYTIGRVGRVNSEVALTLEAIELKSEFSWHRSTLDFDDGETRRFRSFSYYVQLGLWFPGSRQPFGVPVVDTPLFAGGYGALQVCGRFAHMRLDDDLIDHAGFQGARSIDEYAAIVNWFPNEAVRVSLQYTHVRYRVGRALLPSGDRIGREDCVTIRFQVAF